MSQEWYYSVDGDRQGPVSAGDLKKLADAGTIKPGDLVWKDGMSDWVQAKSIKGLFAAAAAAAKNGDQPVAEQAQAAPAEERPSSRGKPRNEDEEDRPRRKRDEDEEDRPRSRKRDEDEEDRPARRRRDEDDDGDRPRRKRSRVPEDTASKKMVSGLLGILLGGWGVHKFYLGMSTAGIIQLVITFVTCGLGGIIGLIEGIIYLTKSDEDFHQTYVVEQKQWF